MTAQLDLLGWLQVAVSVLTLAGVAFATGRLYGRIDAVSHQVTEMRGALFGGDNGDGAFLRRSEAELMATQARQDHKNIDDRIIDISDRLSTLERSANRRG